MFRIVETTHHGDFHKTVSAAAPTVRSAVWAVLKASPYNSKMSSEYRNKLSNALAEETTATYGWSTYTKQYCGDLTNYSVRHSGSDGDEFAVVVEDAGFMLEVRKPWSAGTYTIKHTEILDYQAPKED